MCPNLCGGECLPLFKLLLEDSFHSHSSKRKDAETLTVQSSRPKQSDTHFPLNNVTAFSLWLDQIPCHISSLHLDDSQVTEGRWNPYIVFTYTSLIAKNVLILFLCIIIVCVLWRGGLCTCRGLKTLLWTLPTFTWDQSYVASLGRKFVTCWATSPVSHGLPLTTIQFTYSSVNFMIFFLHKTLT